MILDSKQTRRLVTMSVSVLLSSSCTSPRAGDATASAAARATVDTTVESRRAEIIPTPVLSAVRAQTIPTPFNVTAKALADYLADRDFVAGDSASIESVACAAGDVCPDSALLELRAESGTFKLRSADFSGGWRVLGKIILVKGKSSKLFGLGAAGRVAYWWVGPDSTGRRVSLVTRASDNSIVAGPFDFCVSKLLMNQSTGRHTSSATWRHHHGTLGCGFDPRAGRGRVGVTADTPIFSSRGQFHLTCVPCDEDWCGSEGLLPDRPHGP
jgi:hypothetical protein